MAQLDIDIKVNGEEKLKSLDNTIKEVTEDTKKLGESSAETLSKWALFLGKLGGGLAIMGQVRKAFLDLANAGIQWGQTSDQIAEKADKHNLAWQHVKASLSDVIGLTEAKIAHDEAVLLGMQRITAWITDKSVPAIQAEQKALEARTKAMQDWRTMFEDSLDSYIDKLSDQIDREEYAEEVRDRYNERQKLRELAYEKELEALDAMVDKINAKTDAEIANNEVVEESIENSEDMTKSLEKQTDALDSVASSYSVLSDGQSATLAQFNQTANASGSSAGLYGGAFTTYDNSPDQAEIVRYLREIAEGTRDTNDAVRGY